MLKTRCLSCDSELIITIREGDGYFFGYDTDYYGLTLDDVRDPHEVVGYYCKKCGDKLRTKAESVGWERVVD